MSKITLAELQKQIESYKVLTNRQQEEISRLNKQVEDVHKQQGTVSKVEFDALLTQHENLEERYRILQSLLEKEKKEKSDRINEILKKYESLEEIYNELEILYRKEKDNNQELKKTNEHNVRGAGRKKKLEDNEILLLRAEKMKIKDIAKKLEISIPTVKRVLGRNKPAGKE